MTEPERASKNQLNMLFANLNLYVVEDWSRADRLRWASRNLRREVTSFSELTKAEVASLLDILRMDLERVP